MDQKEIILGKRVLIVDDETDILDVLTELLDLCKIDTAASFDEAKGLLKRYYYDIVILNIGRKNIVPFVNITPAGVVAIGIEHECISIYRVPINSSVLLCISC